MVAVVAASVEATGSCALLLGAGDARTFVRGFVVRERDQLPGEEASFVTVQIEGAALDGLDTDRARVQDVEELFELMGFAVEAVHVPHDHDPGLGILEVLHEALISGTCPVLVGRDRFVDELNSLGVSDPNSQVGAVR